MKRKILGLVLILLGVVGVTNLSLISYDETVYAAANDCGAGTFLGLRPWYAGLCEGDEIKSPQDVSDTDSSSLAAFIWTIVLNIVFDLTVMVGYIATAIVLWAGVQYMAASGDPGKAQKAQSTLINAVTGVAIAMLASVIINTIQGVMGISNLADATTRTELTAEMINGILNWAYAAAGLVAVVFILRGAISYLGTSGDSAKAARAARQIQMAVIGLVIVILAAVITSFVIQTLTGAVS